MWFEVIGDKFDWVVPGTKSMVCYQSGRPHFGTKACVEHGILVGKVRKIKKPEGWRVDKSGKPVQDE